MSNTYEIGDRVRISTETPFQSAAGVAFDPDVVKFQVKAPGTATVTYTYGTDTNVTRSATGDYACDIDVDTAETWFYTIIGETTLGQNRGAAQGHFLVRSRDT